MTNPEEVTRGTLKNAEPHPAAFAARDWLAQQEWTGLVRWQEAFASTALAGNRLAEICSETLTRFMTGQPVSDRYLLGLCWTMRYGSVNKPTRKIKLKTVRGKRDRTR